MKDRVKKQSQLMTYFGYHHHERRNTKADKSNQAKSHEVKRAA